MQFTFFKNTLLIVLPLTMLVCFSCGSQNSEKKDEAKEVMRPNLGLSNTLTVVDRVIDDTEV